jgi:hypothetical protein
LNARPARVDEQAATAFRDLGDRDAPSSQKPSGMKQLLSDIFQKDRSNPWLEQDRQEQRATILAALLAVTAVLGGLAWLAYALIHA